MERWGDRENHLLTLAYSLFPITYSLLTLAYYLTAGYRQHPSPIRKITTLLVRLNRLPGKEKPVRLVDMNI
ncbi:hypothetical protein [Anabaena lutea]|uniref:Uncharacterized protein n=1 Tax=Anabaena lutea FACHB-196 TaxID=2692881 RepID=A0ABR8FDI3_9NOST|nr:hypothetical protein [Anabaena lutea]MBD2567797.1 hypothetical protein [Anabaena lutea FACHB-196]